jgi:hypothetical protein
MEISGLERLNMSTPSIASFSHAETATAFGRPRLHPMDESRGSRRGNSSMRMMTGADRFLILGGSR